MAGMIDSISSLYGNLWALHSECRLSRDACWPCVCKMSAILSPEFFYFYVYTPDSVPHSFTSAFYLFCLGRSVNPLTSLTDIATTWRSFLTVKSKTSRQGN